MNSASVNSLLNFNLKNVLRSRGWTVELVLAFMTDVERNTGCVSINTGWGKIENFKKFITPVYDISNIQYFFWSKLSILKFITVKYSRRESSFFGIKI